VPFHPLGKTHYYALTRSTKLRPVYSDPLATDKAATPCKANERPRPLLSGLQNGFAETQRCSYGLGTTGQEATSAQRSDDTQLPSFVMNGSNSGSRTAKPSPNRVDRSRVVLSPQLERTRRQALIAQDLRRRHRGCGTYDQQEQGRLERPETESPDCVLHLGYKSSRFREHPLIYQLWK
jgi:hypothetical protein